MIGDLYRQIWVALERAAEGDEVALGEYRLFLAHVVEYGGNDRGTIEQVIRGWRPRGSAFSVDDLADEFAQFADLLGEICDGVDVDEPDIPDPRPIAFAILRLNWIEHPFLPPRRPRALLTARTFLQLTGPSNN